MKSPTGRRHARRSVADRFWEKVDRSTPDACWEWTAPLAVHGYGQFLMDYKMYGAHRVAYMLTKGVIPEGKVVMHTCDNRACVNPNHLVVGTQAENLEDMTRKGRRRVGPCIGSRNGTAILNEDDVAAVRAMALTRRFTQEQIGKLFGIDQTTVSLIVTRKKWKHVA